jgi:hypothetical protein
MDSRLNIMRTLTIAILFILCLALAPPARSQGTFTAASCNISDVNAVIHGPTHTAVDGDIIIIPAGSCTWTRGITVSGIGISIIGTGNPSSSPSTYLPDSSCTATVITDALSSGSLLTMTPKYGNATTRLSCMEITAYIPATGYSNAVSISGTCALGGCPNLRLDNLTIPSTWGTSGIAPGDFALLDDMFGVVDHNYLLSDILANVNHSSWQGVGLYGDNSWFSPDTFGTAQALYFENNTLNGGLALTDTTEYGGGARFVCRFNQVDGANNVCYIHGTDTGQRERGGRQEEGYGNVVNSCAGGNCDTLFEFRSGVGIIFGNTITSTSTAYTNSYAKLDSQRTWRQDTPWGSCDGSSVWDTNDGVTYYSGTIGAVQVTSAPFTITDSESPGWTTNEWVPTGAPYSFHDVRRSRIAPLSQTYGVQLGSNTSNVLTFGAGFTSSVVSFRPAVGDSYQILRATVCMDQPTRSGGNLVQSSTPVLASTGKPGAVSEALDPTYEFDDSGLPAGKTPVGALEGQMIANRDFYMGTRGQTAQTSPTSPFDGSSGTGWGTLANRPTTCTPSVGYFATDQGNWNSSGNGFGQGELFVCTATNTWSLHYTPYTYPHPLTQGQNSGLPPAAPQGLTATVQ